MTTMKTTFQQITISELKHSLDNPRDQLNNIEELAASITTWGILQPLTVRKIKDGYEIIAGHRRAKAAELAGLTTVPCVIRSDKGSVVMQQLVENTQRVDLLPYEIAAGINLAVKARKIKQKQLAVELGKSEAWVSKFVTISKAIEKRIGEIKKSHPKEDCETDEQYDNYIVLRAISGDLESHNADTAYLAASKIINPVKKEATEKTVTVPGKEDAQLDIPELEEKQRLLAILVAHIQKHGLPVTGYDVTPSGKTGWRVSLEFESSNALEKHFG